MRQDLLSRIGIVLPVSLLIVTNLFLFGPFSVYRGNSAEFDLGVFSLLAIYLLPAVLLLVALAIPVWILGQSASSRYISICFALGVMLWVQGSFFKGTYGPLDGRALNWDDVGHSGWIDLALWTFALLAAVTFSRHLAKITTPASWSLVVLQAALVLLLSATSEQELWTKEWQTKRQIPEGFLKFSSSKNILHIILDSFQTDVFLELVAAEDLEQNLEGFVVFKENAGVAPYTSLSIPAIFSGRIYDGTESPGSYYQKSIRNGFQNHLFEKGYTVNLIPHEQMRNSKYTHYYDPPTVYGATIDAAARVEAARLLDVSWFRQAPHYLRKHIYNDNNWLITSRIASVENVPSIQAKAFFQDYIENLELGDPTPAYHFLHLIPPHPPYVTLADGSYAGKVLANIRENYKNEAGSILRLFLDLIDQMKRLGVYDSSTIILQGDHGSQIPPTFAGKTLQPCLPRLAALLTIKPPLGRGPLTVSPLQTSLLDVPATVLHLAGFEHEFPGYPLLAPGSTPTRKRPFVIYQGNTPVPQIVKYSIVGSVFDSSACQIEAREQIATARPTYQYGTPILFGLTGNADPFLASGWSLPMSEGCWNNGQEAILKIPLDPPQSDLRLDLNLYPYLQGPQLPEQRIELLANGHSVGEWALNENSIQSLQATIPREVIDTPVLTLTFNLPDATAPRALGDGADVRILGVALYSLVLDLSDPL